MWPKKKEKIKKEDTADVRRECYLKILKECSIAWDYPNFSGVLTYQLMKILSSYVSTGHKDVIKAEFAEFIQRVYY